MAMPSDLVLVRHGESEGNVVVNASKNGDLSGYTDAFVTTPGHQWRLTDLGRAQAACTGAWLREEFLSGGEAFFRCYVSPYVRTRETAGHLGLHVLGEAGQQVSPRWLLNRALRERDWGDIGSMPRADFRARYPDNAHMHDIDPLYWVPPGGESIAHVAENRVRNVLDTLHRECSGTRVLAVTHGELMWAFRLVLERLDDDQYAALEADKTERIHNCEVLHYTARDPRTGQVGPNRRLRWLRRARPVLESGTWRMQVGDWAALEFTTYDNDALLASVQARQQA